MPPLTRACSVLLIGLVALAAGLPTAYAATAPAAPQGPSTLVSASSVRLDWKAPAATGGSAITGYVVERYASGTWSRIAQPGSTARSYTDVNDTASPLKAGVRYSYRVRARNQIGIGSPSASVSAIPFAPTAPRTPTATGGLVRVDLAWAAPVNSGGTPVSAYLVQRRDPGGSTWKTIATTSGAARTYVDANDVGSPIAASSQYGYRVLARNAGGTSLASTVVLATPSGCPSPSTPEVYVNPMAPRIGTIPFTGVSSPAACAFPTITSAIRNARARSLGSGASIVLTGATDAAPARFEHETFPLSVPTGMSVTTTAAATGPAGYVIRFGGTAAYAMDVKGGSITGITLAASAGEEADTMLICRGDHTSVSSVALDGSAGMVERGLWAWPGCDLDLVASKVSWFNGPGVVEEEGALLTLDASEVSHNGGDGVVVRGELDGGSGALSVVGWNGDDGILIERSTSALIRNFEIRSNAGSGVEVHPSKTTVDYSLIYNNSRVGSSWSAPQLLFIGAATDGPLLHDPDTDTDRMAYVVGGDASGTCFEGTNKITGYDILGFSATTVGLRAEGQAVVDARGNSWTSASRRATVDAGSLVATEPACASIGQAPED